MADKLFQGLVAGFRHVSSSCFKLSVSSGQTCRADVRVKILLVRFMQRYPTG
jgi:hypothetical protein